MAWSMTRTFHFDLNKAIIWEGSEIVGTLLTVYKRELTDVNDRRGQEKRSLFISRVAFIVENYDDLWPVIKVDGKIWNNCKTNRANFFFSGPADQD